MSNSARGEFTGRFRWLPVLAAEGFDVTFVLPTGEDPYADRMERSGVPILRYRLDRHSVAWTDEIRTLRDVIKALVRRRFHIVHSFGHKANMYAGVAATLTRTPLRFQHVTGLGDPFIPGRETVKRRIARLTLERGYRLLAPTMSAVFFQNADDQARFAFLPPGKAVLTHGTGVNPKEFSPDAVSPDTLKQLQQELDLAPGDPVVTFIGRLKPEKGIPDLVAAARSVHDAYPRAVFLIVGDHDAAHPLAGLVQSNHDPRRIRLLGHRDDTREILALTDVFVNPSRREGLPRSNLEAMAMAKPVVTTDVPGCRDTVADGGNGFLVAPGNVDSLSSAILRLLSSPDLRERMGRAGRARVETEFDVADVARHIAAVYRSAIAPTAL